MGIELVLFAAIGCILGTITGLIPGLHVNTIAIMATALPKQDNLGLMVMIATMSITHTFVDFIPSIILGAPSEETFLGVLPGHRLLLQGKAAEAIRLTVIGGLAAGTISMLTIPAFVLFLEKNKEMIIQATPWVLATILILMALDEKNKATATAIIALSGTLGILALKSPIQVKEPLFCLATGFFGASSLIDSLLKKTKMPKQEKSTIGIGKALAAKNSAMAVIGGLTVSMMPSIGASQAAFILGKAIGKINPREYLVMLGGTNTSTMILSFTVLYATGKTRTGSAVAISSLGSLGPNELMAISAASLIAMGYAAIATGIISTRMLKNLEKIEYKKISTMILAAVTAMVLATSGTTGIMFYATATLIGLAAITAGVKRTNTMAFLMVPTIMHYTRGLL